MFFVGCWLCDKTVDGFSESLKGWGTVHGSSGICNACSQIKVKLKCYKCGRWEDAPEALKAGWVKLFDSEYSGEVDWMCWNCDTLYNSPDVIGTGHAAEIRRRQAEKAIKLDPKWLADTARTAAKEEQGFNQPEDGSKERYAKRRKATPWAKHTFWWFIHNVISHPLIGVLPFGPMFKFHDWTSRKMHGVK